MGRLRKCSYVCGGSPPQLFPTPVVSSYEVEEGQVTRVTWTGHGSSTLDCSDETIDGKIKDDWQGDRLPVYVLEFTTESVSACEVEMPKQLPA